MDEKILDCYEIFRDAKRRGAILTVRKGPNKFTRLAIGGEGAGAVDYDEAEFLLLKDCFRRLDFEPGMALLPPPQVQTTDAAGMLCLVVSSILPSIWAFRERRSVQFLTELSQMLHQRGYPGDSEAFLCKIILTVRNSYKLGHLVYNAKGRCKLDDAAIFCLLARFGTKKAPDGTYMLTADGDAPAIWSLGQA